ncbi:MAG TPA: hypothetical protein VM344_04470, partial [Vitreimonas sp.]|nr:hypothetical protein [Vitreimonas sp.]
AWITMPVLIAVFAAGAYGFGAALRGLDVIVNEVAIVRGAPDATEGTAQVYLGVFSPSRGTYQLEVAGGALLTSTLTGESFGGVGSLDVLQGDPARIRDLVVGFGSLRTVRAEAPATVPRIQADLRLDAGSLRGSIRNLSDQTLEAPAVVFGASVVVLGRLDPGSEQHVNLPLRRAEFGQSLSDRILGSLYSGDPNRTSDSTQRSAVRHAVIDQLSYDPSFENPAGQLPSETPVLLAWGSEQVLDVRISEQVPRRTGNVLYYIPLPMQVRGPAVFEGDLVKSSVVEQDVLYLHKDWSGVRMSTGTATIAYRPIAFEGSLAVTKVALALNAGDGARDSGGRVLEVADPQPCRDVEAAPPDCTEFEPPTCNPNVEHCFEKGFDHTPALELFDRADGGRWVRMASMEAGKSYEIDDPDRYIDPASGTLLVRFVNELEEEIGFTFQVRISGEVR